MPRFTYASNRILDSNGVSDGASVYLYQTGTTTKISLYSDSACTNPTANPCVVAAGAIVPDVYFTYSGNIRVYIISNSGEITDIDPYPIAVSTASLAPVAVSGAAADLTGLATVATTGSAASLTGTLAVARLPALTGDVTSSVGTGVLALTSATVLSKISGQTTTPASVAATGNISTSAGGLGFATGNGGTVTQLTSKSTAVTLNSRCGQITTNSASLASAAGVAFTLNNSTISANDVIIVNLASGSAGSTYSVMVTAVAAGSCRIQIRNDTAGALAETLVLNFAVIDGVAS